MERCELVASSMLVDQGLLAWSGVVPKFRPPFGGRIMCEEEEDVTPRQLRSAPFRLSSSAALERCRSEFSIRRLLLAAFGLLLLLLLFMDAIGEAMEPPAPPFSSEDVDVSSSDCGAAESCSEDSVLTTLAATSDEMAALEMVGMLELAADIGPVPAINSPCCSSGFLPPGFWTLLLLLLSHGSTSEAEFGLVDDGSDATEGLRPPPAPTFEPFVRCLMFSRLLMLNVSSSDWLDIESLASTDPPYRKSPICSVSSTSSLYSDGPLTYTLVLNA